jgi:hypothetical protein
LLMLSHLSLMILSEIGDGTRMMGTPHNQVLCG